MTFQNVSKPTEKQPTYRCPCCGCLSFHGHPADRVDVLVHAGPPRRVGVKAIVAAVGAEEIGLALMFKRTSGSLFIDNHATHRIDRLASCRRGVVPVDSVDVVVTLIFHDRNTRG